MTAAEARELTNITLTEQADRFLPPLLAIIRREAMLGFSTVRISNLGPIITVRLRELGYTVDGLDVSW